MKNRSEGLPWLGEIEGGVVLRLVLAPRASSERILGIHGDELKIAVTAPPIDGSANEALIRFLAKRCRVARSSVVLKSGEHNKHKVIVILGVTYQQAIDVLS